MKTCVWVPGSSLIRFLLMLACVFITHFAVAQVSYSSKFSPILLDELTRGKAIPATRIELVVTIKNGIFPIELSNPTYNTQKLFESEYLTFYS